VEISVVGRVTSPGLGLEIMVDNWGSGDGGGIAPEVRARAGLAAVLDIR
jgi:hypothetical protein